jgi:cellulose synthase (UDP-forming)
MSLQIRSASPKQAIAKYQMLYQNPILFRVYLAANIVCIALNYITFIPFLDSNIYTKVLFLPFVFINSVFYLVTTFTSFLYTKVNLSEHESLISKPRLNPSVDIYLPICGEDIKILKKTWHAVSNLNWKNINVYVLDDKADKMGQLLSKKLGFKYISRPNKGYMKKAGNLRYAFPMTNGEFIAIFDADFVPDKNFLNETVPYMMKDPSIGILQTPQYFNCTTSVHSANPLEYGAGQIQEEFYKSIQVSRDAVGGSICVGSNALYRRKALAKIGGTYEIEHSEDIWTGLALIMEGYRVKYLPINLAVGLSPTNLDQYIRQQYRWCQGTISIAFSKVFWTSKIPIGTRFSFLSGLLYYMTVFGYFVLPFTIFIVVFNNPEAIGFLNSIYFYPGLVLMLIGFKYLYIQPLKYGSFYARFFATAAYAMSIIHYFLGISLAWTPTGEKSAVNYWVKFLIHTMGLYWLAYLLLSVFSIATGRLRFNVFDHYSVLIFLFTTNLMLGSYIFNAYTELLPQLEITNQAKPIIRRFQKLSQNVYINTIFNVLIYLFIATSISLF